MPVNCHYDCFGHPGVSAVEPQVECTERCGQRAHYKCVEAKKLDPRGWTCSECQCLKVKEAMKHTRTHALDDQSGAAYQSFSRVMKQARLARNPMQPQKVAGILLDHRGEIIATAISGFSQVYDPEQWTNDVLTHSQRFRRLYKAKYKDTGDTFFNHRFRHTGAYDQYKPGQFHACHAETKLMACFIEDLDAKGILSKNQEKDSGPWNSRNVHRCATIYVSTPMCPQCESFLERINRYYGVDIEVLLVPGHESKPPPPYKPPVTRNQARAKTATNVEVEKQDMMRADADGRTGVTTITEVRGRKVSRQRSTRTADLATSAQMGRESSSGSVKATKINSKAAVSLKSNSTGRAEIRNGPNASKLCGRRAKSDTSACGLGGHLSQVQKLEARGTSKLESSPTCRAKIQNGAKRGDICGCKAKGTTSACGRSGHLSQVQKLKDCGTIFAADCDSRAEREAEDLPESEDEAACDFESACDLLEGASLHRFLGAHYRL